jgi:hypothetical protein
VLDPELRATLKFSKEEPVIIGVNGELTDMLKEIRVNRDEWKDKMAAVSRELVHKRVTDSGASFFAEQVVRYLVNSEGTRVASSFVRY